MRYLLLLFSAFFCSILYGQNNAIRVTLNGYTKYSREEITIDTFTNSIPRTTGGVTNYHDLSLSFLKEIVNLYLFGGIGVGWIKGHSSTEDIGFSQKRLTIIEDSETNMKFHIGVLNNMITHERLNFFVGVGTKFDYRISKRAASRRSLFDENSNDYLEGQEFEFDFARFWRLGPTIELGCYYRFIGNFHLGINFTPWFYFQKEIGDEQIEITQFGENKLLLSESGFYKTVNKTLFTRSQTFSYSLLWKF